MHINLVFSYIIILNLNNNFIIKTSENLYINNLKHAYLLAKSTFKTNE
jgi:hypothetical protein